MSNSEERYSGGVFGSGPIVGVEVSATGVDAGRAEFETDPKLNGHLGRECFLALARDPKRNVVIDHHPARKPMNAGLLLAVAVALGKRWRAATSARRVGIVLPPGIGAFLANLGVLFAGRIPVNLNFTAGAAAINACIRKGGIDLVISADALREKVPTFPWPDRTIDIRREIDACGKLGIIKWLLAAKLFPAGWLAGILKLPETGGDEEAALLFTSGSAGEPKGVALTHRNILGNVRQVFESGLLKEGRIMIGCLPVFHSFGFTVTMWYPILRNMQVATFPSPLETRRIAEIIEEEKAHILVGAPTFLRPFLKRADPEQLRSLELVVAGAEKLPRDLYDGFIERFGVSILEGYGLTETSPVLSVNHPDPVTLVGGGSVSGHHFGSVGILLNGMEARILDPDSLEPRDPRETGILAVRGVNVFGGYLGDEEQTRSVLRDGWFITGDLARFNETGFLFIEGRLSRFSKLGGEMVPHISVEQRIMSEFGLDGREQQPVVVVGVPDAAKGESLVVLSTEPLTVDAVREKLSAAGLPNLWIPKKVIVVEKIPVLGSGKLDLRGCKERAARG